MESHLTAMLSLLFQIGKQSVWLKPAFESYETIHHTAFLDAGPQTLCPGEHSFGFSFVVPDDTAAFDNSL